MLRCSDSECSITHRCSLARSTHRSRQHEGVHAHSIEPSTRIVPFMPSFPIAAASFLVREGLVELDVPTRQSYVMAVVRPEERAFASGVTHLVRLAGWAIAPAIAGCLMSGSNLALPLVFKVIPSRDRFSRGTALRNAWGPVRRREGWRGRMAAQHEYADEARRCCRNCPLGRAVGLR